MYIVIDINIKKYGLFDDLPEGNQKVETLLGDIDHFIAFITYNDNVFWNYKETPEKTPFTLDSPDEFWRFE